MTSKQTTIKYLTDGVLLRESISSCFYSYDVVILDEAHERSLDTDILIGLLKSHLAKHRHFRLIITSATIDVSLFSTFFNNCPVITIPGRQFPIEILHSSCKLDKRVEYTVNAAIRIHLHEGPGDILVFLTGSDECERAKNRCYEALSQLEEQGTSVASMIILALYGAMSSEEQSKVFQETPEDCRKVVFSTNISETSITLDGIGFVIDCGYVKQKQYNSQTGLESLLIIPISKQQAKQRAGRAGRTSSGKCFRLYSESFYSSQMPESHQAEIFRSNLSSVILTLKTLGIRSILDFSFLQSPNEQAILDAIKQLYWIEAVDDSGSITLLGKELCKFPLDPTFSRCLVSSIVTDCADEMIQVKFI
jgi:ATP-dependent RNA helicase DHX8/PRP22